MVVMEGANMKTMKTMKLIDETKPMKRKPPRRRAAYAEFVRNDFFAPPWWRWWRALALATSPSRQRARLREDQMTLAGVGFIRSRACGSAPKTRLHCLLSEALSIFSDNGTTRWSIEAYMLTGISREAIADKLGLGVALIGVYEEMFYDVRSRLGARDWVCRHSYGIGGPNRGFQGGGVGSLWRWVGYNAGEFVLDAVRAVTTGIGAENYPQSLRESIERFHALTQFLGVCTGSELNQLYIRLRARETGIPASVYLVPARPTHGRGNNRGSPGHPDSDATGDPAPQPPRTAAEVRLLDAGWETRDNDHHYFHVVQVDGRRRRIWLGSGAIGRMHELLDRQEHHEHQEQHYQGRLDVKAS